MDSLLKMQPFENFSRSGIIAKRKSCCCSLLGKCSSTLQNIDIMSSVVDTALLHTRKRSFTTGNILADDAVQNDLTKSNKECTYKSLSVKDLQSSSARLTLSQSIEDEAPPVECIMGMFLTPSPSSNQ